MKQLEQFYADTTPLGTPLITRDGREVSEWHYFKSANNPYPVKAVVDGQIYNYTKDGRYYKIKIQDANDLFIKPKVRDIWVNVCVNQKGELDISSIYPSYISAINNRVRGIDYIKTIRITDEVE